MRTCSAAIFTHLRRRRVRACRTRNPARCARSASPAPTRLATLPDIPAIADAVPGYEVERLVRFRRAEEHAGGGDREAQQPRSMRALPIRSLRRRLAQL